MRSGRDKQVGSGVPFGVQSAAVSSQPAQGAYDPAKLTQIKVDQGPDGRTRPEVVMGNPEISTLSEGTAITPTVRGARLPLSIPWSWLSRPGRRGYSGDVLLYREDYHLHGYWSAMPIATCRATVPRTRHSLTRWTPSGSRGLQLGPH